MEISMQDVNVLIDVRNRVTEVIQTARDFSTYVNALPNHSTSINEWLRQPADRDQFARKIMEWAKEVAVLNAKLKAELKENRWLDELYGSR